MLIFCAMLFGGIYCLIRNICRRMKEQQAMIDAGMQHGGYGAGGMGQRGYAAEEVDSGVGYSVAVSNRLFKEWTSERMDLDYIYVTEREREREDESERDRVVGCSLLATTSMQIP